MTARHRRSRSCRALLRATHDYERDETCSRFAALNIASGTVITDISKTYNPADFLAFLSKIDANVPSGLDVEVVFDNLATHKTPKVYLWLLRHRRFHFQFAPPMARG